MSRALLVAGGDRQRRERRRDRRVEGRRRPWRAGHGDAHARDRRRRRPDPRRQALSRLGRCRSGARPHGPRVRRRAVRGRLHRPWPHRAACASGGAADRRGGEDPGPGRDWPRARRRSSRRERGGARRGRTEIGRLPRGGDRVAREHLQPRGRSSSAAGSARRATCFLEPALRGDAARRRCRRAASSSASFRLCSGPTPASSVRPSSGFEALASSAARGLRDSDRQPRGRDAAGAARARARPSSSCARTRGGRGSSSSGTGSSAKLAQLPRAQRGRARRRRCCRGCVAGERVALTSDAGLPGVSDPGARLDRGGAGVRGAGDRAPGALGGRDGARRERPRGRAVPVPRVSASGGEGARGALGGARALAATPAVAFESPQRLPATPARRSPPVGPSGPVAVCRELTKRFEEVVRGTAAELAERFRGAAEGRDHARDRSVRGRAGRRRGDALAAVAELVGPERARRQAAEVVSRLTGVSRNRLYRGSL